MFREMFFKCERLTSKEKNKQLIQNFFIERESKCKKIWEETGIAKGLDLYLKLYAWNDDLENNVRLYIIKTVFTNEVVAYFGLKAGMVSSNLSQRDREKEEEALQRGIKLVPETLSGIEISHFAVNDLYRKKHGYPKGLGKYIFPKFILPIINEVSEQIGVKVLYLYAADSSDDNGLVSYYKDVFGFKEGQYVHDMKPVTSYYDDYCVFMYRMQ